jgi:protein-disulfide isomerase
VVRHTWVPVLVLAVVAACGGARTEAAAPARRQVPVFPGLDITDAVALGMVDGASTAQLTVVEAIDFACPHCERMQGPLDELVREYGGRVRVVYKNCVLPQHSGAAHLAACAAGKQGKYRAFADALRAERARHAMTEEQIVQALREGGAAAVERVMNPEVDLAALARDIGLDTAAFDAERSGAWCRAFLDRDQAEMDKLGIDHLPMFFIADKRADPMTKEALRAAIDAGLAGR